MNPNSKSSILEGKNVPPRSSSFTLSAASSLVDYSHHRADLGPGSSYRMSRMSRRSIEKCRSETATTTTTACQERRLSALKKYKQKRNPTSSTEEPMPVDSMGSDNAKVEFHLRKASRTRRTCPSNQDSCSFLDSCSSSNTSRDRCPRIPIRSSSAHDGVVSAPERALAHLIHMNEQRQQKKKLATRTRWPKSRLAKHYDEELTVTPLKTVAVAKVNSARQESEEEEDEEGLDLSSKLSLSLPSMLCVCVPTSSHDDASVCSSLSMEQPEEDHEGAGWTTSASEISETEVHLGDSRSSSLGVSGSSSQRRQAGRCRRSSRQKHVVNSGVVPVVLFPTRMRI